ncbi:hypothetical protein Hsar01_02259 [Haloferula sargassicola]|uniref:Uncharacterized protein n=1 Tax=Haloferula sargassicola TaxID=490096 RepID=A0ABP9UQN3_9BACT
MPAAPFPGPRKLRRGRRSDTTQKGQRRQPRS